MWEKFKLKAFWFLLSALLFCAPFINYLWAKYKWAKDKVSLLTTQKNLQKAEDLAAQAHTESQNAEEKLKKDTVDFNNALDELDTNKRPS